jgi:hypothetical protein
MAKVNITPAEPEVKGAGSQIPQKRSRSTSTSASPITVFVDVDVDLDVRVLAGGFVNTPKGV